MITRRALLAALAASWALSLSPLARAAAATDADPSAWIVEMMNVLLDDIRRDPELIKADPTRVHSFVDERIMPNVDFVRMTRTAVGPQWRSASAEQREALQKGFRDLLIRVYSGAFSSVKDYKAELVQSRAKDASDTPIIRTRLVSSSEQPVRVDYRMKKTNDAWKVIDVNIAGIWMVQNYHSQFASILSNGGVPALVSALSDKNSALNKSAK